MTREEKQKAIDAVERLNVLKQFIGYNKDSEIVQATQKSLDMAIKALEQRWIPVTEKLPEEDEMVLVSCRTVKGVNSVNRAYYANGHWHGSGSMSGVKAWQPLPDPFEGEVDG